MKMISCFAKKRMNAQLKKDIENVFSPLGIVGYSGCCRLGCTGSYDETDENFRFRPKGILYFKLFLSGMNYDQHPSEIAVQYDDLDWVNQNWQDEKALIDRWCAVVGLKKSDYSVERPDSEDKAILIRFKKPLDLDDPDDDDDDASDDQ